MSKENAWEQVDFSLIKDMEEKLQTILKTTPLFYDKDFKQILHTAYRHWKKQAQRLLDETNTQAADEALFYQKWGPVASWGQFGVVINDTLHCEHFYNEDGKALSYHHKLPEYALLEMLAELPAQRLNQFCEHLRFWHLLNQFVIKLISCAAFVPQILQNR